MSFKYLNMKLGIFALGLVVIIGLSAVLGVSEQVRAATASVECSKTLSGQAETCAKERADATEDKSFVTAWFFPQSKPQGSENSAVSAGTPGKGGETVAQDNSASGFPPEALILFAVALAGIVFLGRRKKSAVREE
ncbi:hypothetical protein J0X12_13250 [Sneathiella sp. CAU 1612]|uniref:PEP-CTERM protein-sorting domain-containing protein n=1 Tax=Sneathiella sedimenti TaxID=2816034 RepID=A0ABS3F7U8_9PROT|nr:hypothetical protein [Sneathiella sedimenti]MBO0334589.1 hypothetical protein [Sneathiella sedimenti]